jgi:methionyl-tRNA formyltransferase
LFYPKIKKPFWAKIKKKGEANMKVAYVGIDLMLPALLQLGEMADVEILKIFTCPCLYEGETVDGIIAFAKSHCIPYTQEKMTANDLAALAEAGCEMLLCAGYYYRLPITDAFPMINIHPAPLPDCRGAWPMPWLLLWGKSKGGVVFHKMAEQFDTGEILLEKDFPLTPAHTLADYMADANALLPGMVDDLLSHLPAYLKNARPQTEGRYLKNPTEEDWTVTDQMTVEEADKILRAFYGYPCVYRKEGLVAEISFARADYGTPKGIDLPLKDGRITFS